MNRLLHPNEARLTRLALALLAVHGTAMAQAPSENETTASIGVATLPADAADRARFGQYNGLRSNGSAWLTLDLEHYRHDQADDTTLQIQGSNLTLQTREFGLRWKHQSDWKLGLDYSEGVRYDPNTVNTALLGAGTTTPQVVVAARGAGGDQELRLKRTSLGLSVWKSLTPTLDLEVSLKSEDKTGSRLFGTGMTCPSPIAPGCRGTTGSNAGWALLMLPEPVDANHSQIEARLSYGGEKLQLSGGYYGSFYNNRHDLLSPGVPSSLNNPLGSPLPLSNGLQAILGLPLALPPDNQAHHFDISGGYTFTPKTRLSFKLGYSQALQHQDFAGTGLTGAPAGVANLGGRVATTLAQVGVNARPTPKLTLFADFRYEDRDDQTPLALYNVEGAATYTNRSLPNRKTRAKLQAAYQFSTSYRGLVAIDQEAIDRGVFTATSAVAGISALRQKTEETTLRGELRRTLSETLSGSLGAETSHRDGSNWLRPNSGLGVTEVPDSNAPGSGLGNTAIFMPTLADRDRHKLRARVDWQPAENLSLQFSGDLGKDQYKSPSLQGVDSTRMDLLALDFDYAWSERWSFNGYLSQSTQRLYQSRLAGYLLSFRNTNAAAGLGVLGKPVAKVEVGANLSYVEDRNAYRQTLDGFASPDSVALLTATGGLPDVIFRQATWRLFGKYEIDKLSSVRLDLLHQRSRQSDWTWGYGGVPFAYSDGTTVWQNPNQAVTLVAMTFSYKWR